MIVRPERFGAAPVGDGCDDDGAARADQATGICLEVAKLDDILQFAGLDLPCERREASRVGTISRRDKARGAADA